MADVGQASTTRTAARVLAAANLDTVELGITTAQLSRTVRSYFRSNNAWRCQVICYHVAAPEVILSVNDAKLYLVLQVSFLRPKKVSHENFGAGSLSRK